MNVILITSAFPFGTCEQFLETELRYWSKRKDVTLTVIPKRIFSGERIMPPNVLLNTSCSCYDVGFRTGVKYILKSFISPLFIKEACSQFFRDPRRIFRALVSFSKYLYFTKLFNEYLKKEMKPDTVIYTYWFDEATYALQALKNEYAYKLISRAHGDDVYEEANTFSYLPFRTRFTKNIDHVFTITPSAEEYMSQRFAFDRTVLETSRLGVADLNIRSTPTPDGEFHLVSCSYLVPVKRVEKIVDAIAAFAEVNTSLNIHWTHIGGGELYDEILRHSKNKLDDKKNVNFSFLGQIQNEAVYVFYKNHMVDLFINLSESEGVPVSIMEALSCEIPVLAPDIGGMSDMVSSNVNGVLLNKNFSIDDVVGALSQLDFFKADTTRENSFSRFKEHYDADYNYPLFINRVLEIAEGEVLKF